MHTSLGQPAGTVFDATTAPEKGSLEGRDNVAQSRTFAKMICKLLIVAVGLGDETSWAGMAVTSVNVHEWPPF